jgi:hypothetical protein
MRILFVVGVLVLAGCGSADDGTAALDSFVQEVAAEQCAWEFRCCTDAEIKTQEGRKFADPASCVPYRALALESPLYAVRLAARQRKLRLDDKKAQACLWMLKTRACNPRPGLSAPTPSLSADACGNVFDGATPAGEPCRFGGECVDGAHCVMDARVRGAGVCVPYQREHEVCNDGGDCDPAAGLTCDPATSTCKSLPDGGAPPSAPVAPSMSCVGRV